MESEFVWMHEEEKQAWCELSPFRSRPLNALRALLLDYDGTARILDKQNDMRMLRNLLEQATQTNDAETLRNLRRRLLTLVHQMSFQEEPVQPISPEQDAAALTQFLDGIATWDEDPLDLLGW